MVFILFLFCLDLDRGVLTEAKARFPVLSFSVLLVRVVGKVDNTIHRIAWFLLLTLIHGIAIYPYPGGNKLRQVSSRCSIS